MECQLTYLLKQLTTDERDELIGLLGISEPGYYLKRANPGTFRLSEAVVLHRFLEKRYKRDLNLAKMLKPIRLAA